MDALEAIESRWSVRAFLDKPVAQDTVARLLATASRAPSGSNTQPWKVAVVTGDSKETISDAMIAARESGADEDPDYQYYPSQWFDPFKARRFTCGMALYEALEIKREDLARRKDQWFKNYRFFDAPVGLIFLIHKDLDKGSWVDIGMFIQSVMIAARGLGLGTCPQASIAEFPNIIREKLNISSDYHVVCGMALGYADDTDPVNHYRTERESVEDFCQWYG